MKSIAANTSRGTSTITALIVLLGIAVLVYGLVMYVTRKPSQEIRPDSAYRVPVASTVKPLAPAAGMPSSAQPDSGGMDKPQPSLFPPPGPALAGGVEAPAAVSKKFGPNTRKLQQLRAVQTRLQELVKAGNGTIDPAKLDPILADLQTVQGNDADIGGVDIGLLRRNLKRAVELQRLGLEIQQLAKNPKQMDTTAFNAAIARVKTLQGELEIVPMPGIAPEKTQRQTGEQ